MGRVLVVGGAGFIGSHLVDSYLQDDDEVCALDNLITGCLDNLTSAHGMRRFVFINVDITADVSATARTVEERFGVPDLILHFASPASPVDYGNNPIETMRVNSVGTEHCALLALRWKARMLFASTSESYGDPLVHPQPETYWGNVNPVGVRSCYDESKRYGEALCMSYVRKHAADIRVLRIFNTYGPRMRKNDGRVVPNFIVQSLEGKPLTIYGDGLQTRSFCYVDDLVDGIRRCAASAETHGRVVNLGNPEEFTIREFAEIVCEVAGVPLSVEHRPMPPDDPTRRNPDITVARTLLEWHPKVGIREGVLRTMTAMKQPALV